MAIQWERTREYGDIVYETAEGIAKITIHRPEVHNAFRPKTLFELSDAFSAARDDPRIGGVAAPTKAIANGPARSCSTREKPVLCSICSGRFARCRNR